MVAFNKQILSSNGRNKDGCLSLKRFRSSHVKLKEAEGKELEPKHHPSANSGVDFPPPVLLRLNLGH